MAMQFFYQFPQRTERLALISSGGLGREVSPLLRGAALPGASTLLRLAAQPRLLGAIDAASARLHARNSSKGAYLKAISRALRPLQKPGSRRAFLETLRSVIDVHGQRVSARDLLYLLDGMPTLIVWGALDRTIPISHGLDAQRSIPNCRFESLPRAAHFPHLEDPAGLGAVLDDFLATTVPARIEDSEWGAVIGQCTRRRLGSVKQVDFAG